MEQTENQEIEQEKRFTQEDVNRILANRLARVKNETDVEFGQREAELSKRELLLDAREKLTEVGLSKELVTAINCSDRETMEKSIHTIIAAIGTSSERGIQPTTYRVSTGTAATGSQGSEDDSIRAAMGLKR